MSGDDEKKQPSNTSSEDEEDSEAKKDLHEVEEAIEQIRNLTGGNTRNKHHSTNKYENHHGSQRAKNSSGAHGYNPRQGGQGLSGARYIQQKEQPGPSNQVSFSDQRGVNRFSRAKSIGPRQNSTDYGRDRRQRSLGVSGNPSKRTTDQQSKSSRPGQGREGTGTTSFTGNVRRR